MLLAGEVWAKLDEQPNGVVQRQKHFLRLSCDQALLVWAPWRPDDECDGASERTMEVAKLTCVSELPERLGLLLSIDGGEKVTFEAAMAPQLPHLWADALSRLLAINRQRHSYETLFGGVSDSGGSPRSLAVSSPPISEALSLRASTLLKSQQRAVVEHSGRASTIAWEKEQEEEQQRAMDAQAQVGLPQPTREGAVVATSSPSTE